MTTASVTPHEQIRDAHLFGVGRTNRWVHPDPLAPDRLAVARGAVARWQDQRAVSTFRLPALFPFVAVGDYVRSVGRNAVDPILLRELRRISLTLASDRGVTPASAEAAQLAGWLDMALDVPGGNYDSYLGSALFDRLPDRLPMYSRSQVLDTTAVTVLADLVLAEAEALTCVPDDPGQVGRVRACLQALRAAAGFAPDAVNVRHAAGSAVPADALNPYALSAFAERTGASVLDATPDCIRRTVATAMLPTTTVHDEVMFLRSIQVFECVYHQAALLVDIAIDEILGGDPAAAVAELNCAATRIEASRVLYRVVTTMPRDSFAVIRGATDGRSAIQSGPYNRMEKLCAGTDSFTDEGGTSVRPAFQDLVRSRRAELGDFFAEELIGAARGLDTSWRAMKRTHWGVALKIIGRVPGTGGTAGADYLQVKSTEPLFPALRPAERDTTPVQPGVAVVES